MDLVAVLVLVVVAAALSTRGLRLLRPGTSAPDAQSERSEAA